MSENRWVHIALTLINELFTLLVLMLKAVCTVFLFLPSAVYPVGAESISSFLLSSKVNPISSAWITQFFPTAPSLFMCSKSWSSFVTQSLSLFWIMWSRILSITRRFKVFSGKTALIWSATALQLTFDREILCKSCNDVGSRWLELFKTLLRASIANMLCIEAWNGVLISVPSVFVSTISIHLVRACFWIFLHTSAAPKLLFGITLIYIVACRKALERSTSGRNSILELVLSSIFHKQYWVCARLVYLRHSFISADLYLWKVMQIAY